MWRRTYLFLVLVRLWFAMSPSYLHPDENFQGPEVIAGKTGANPFIYFSSCLGAYLFLLGARAKLGLGRIGRRGIPCALCPWGWTELPMSAPKALWRLFPDGSF